MQFLDLAGVKTLWAKISALAAQSKTTVEGQSASGSDAYVSVSGAAVEGSGNDGHTNYTVELHNAASQADVAAAKQALYGAQVPAQDALTLTGLNSAIEDLAQDLSEVTPASADKTINVNGLDLAVNIDNATLVKNAQTGVISAGLSIAKTAGASGDTFLAKYKLVDSNNNPLGEEIVVNKDSALKSFELVASKPVDGGDPISGQFLKYVYTLADGSEATEYVDVSSFLVESEFANGLAAGADGVVRGVVDNSGEFLSVGANGFKVSGVSDAISAAKAELKGAAGDAASAETIAGAKAYADDAVAAVAGNYATAAQGALADTAIQGVTGETAIASGNSAFVAVAASEDAAHEVTLSSTVKVQSVAGASASAQGLAEASDVKSYVDSAVANKNVSAQGETGDSALVSASASSNAVTVEGTTKLHNAVAKAESAIQGVKVNGTALTPDADKVVNVTIVEGDNNGEIKVNGVAVAVHGLGSAAYTAATAYDAAGAADAMGEKLYGDEVPASGNLTIKGLDTRLAALEGNGEGSVADQISDAIDALDSSIASTGTASGDNKVATQSAVDAETQSAQYFLTGVTIDNGKIASGTATKIEGIPVATLNTILV